MDGLRLQVPSSASCVKTSISLGEMYTMGTFAVDGAIHAKGEDLIQNMASCFAPTAYTVAPTKRTQWHMVGVLSFWKIRDEQG